MSGRWAKARARAAARARDAGMELSHDDLDRAVTFEGPMPPITDALRTTFRDVVAAELRAVTLERGLVTDDPVADHVRRALTRVAV